MKSHISPAMDFLMLPDQPLVMILDGSADIPQGVKKPHIHAIAKMKLFLYNLHSGTRKRGKG
jgi:hypothetical protein